MRLVRNSYEHMRNLIEIIAKFVVHVIRVEIRIMEPSTKLGHLSREIRAKVAKMACNVWTPRKCSAVQRDTCPSHGHVIDHSPHFAFFGGLQAETVLMSYHAVAGRAGGMNAPRAKETVASASVGLALPTSSW